MIDSAPTEVEVEQIRTLVSKEWADGVERSYKSLTLRKITWHERDHREFAVLAGDVLIEVVDLDECLKRAGGDEKDAARRLTLKLEEIHQFKPANGEQWRDHWETVQEKADLIG